MTTLLPETTDLKSIFVEQRPLLDLRAPVEFAQGALPGAVNAPLLNDEERHQVGIRYKEAGQEAAIELGKSFYTAEVRERRLEEWRRFAAHHPDGLLYCFRGGLRSKLTQQLLHEAGITIPRVRGGYKAMRRFLIEATEQVLGERQLLVIGGYTGVGKTDLINLLPNSIDLEGLANHRGSAFGRRVTPQPTQIDFENALAVVLLKCHHNSDAPIYVEDEGRNIGSCGLPRVLVDAMQRAPILLLEAALARRVEIGIRDYVSNPIVENQKQDGAAGFGHFAEATGSSLARIARRLGGTRYQQAVTLLDNALASHAVTQTADEFEPLVRFLLEHYYDPMYQYQLEKKVDRIVFRGSAEQIRALAADTDWRQKLQKSPPAAAAPAN